MIDDTLVVNLFAGPGTGKSTTAALTFGKLKLNGVNAELAHEWAKEAAWEGRRTPLRFQPYVVGKQMWRVHRLLGEVEVVITDSPILLSLVYGKGRNIASFEQFVADTFCSWRTLNIFIKRDADHHPYNPKGRLQTQDEAERLDYEIYEVLAAHAPGWYELEMSDDLSDRIVDLIMEEV